MKRTVAIAAGLPLALIALALLLDAFVGATQPELQPGSKEGVLYTFDAEGNRHATRLAVVEDEEAIWVQSGHHFRGWYERVLQNPEVEMERGGERRQYLAVPIDTPESESHVVELLKRNAGSELRFRMIRALLLWADIKPVRLDPR